MTPKPAQNSRIIVRFASIIGAAIVLAGCQSSFRGGPPTSLDPKRDLLQIAVEDALKKENVAAALSAPDKTNRNSIVFARIAEIDRLYYDYERDLSSELRRSDLFTELVALGAGIAGTLTTTEQASRVFSAVSTAVAGTHTAFNEKFLVDQTVQALTSTMRANRDTTKEQIFRKLNKSIADYPLVAALSDLELYRQAGTLPGAMLGISQTANAAATDAKAKADAAEREFNVLRTVETGQVALNLTKRLDDIKAIVREPANLPDARALALANRPPAINAEFSARLAKARGSDATFTNQLKARIALDRAIDALRSEDEVKAWEAAVRQ
jgi:hypothetical protein